MIDKFQFNTSNVGVEIWPTLSLQICQLNDARPITDTMLATKIEHVSLTFFSAINDFSFLFYYQTTLFKMSTESSQPSQRFQWLHKVIPKLRDPCNCNTFFPRLINCNGVKWSIAMNNSPWINDIHITVTPRMQVQSVNSGSMYISQQTSKKFC